MTLFERLQAALVESGGTPHGAASGAMPLSRSAVAVGDTELVRWATSEPQPLVPILRYAGVMRPLVVLLAVLPALFAFQTRPLTADGAEWSLRALVCLQATTVAEVLDTGRIEQERLQPANRWRMHPPAMTWLTATSMKIFGSQRDGSRSAVAMAATALLIGSIFLLLQALGGDRLALIGTVLVACQGVLLRFSQQPGIEPLALLVVLLTLRQWKFRLQGRTFWNGVLSALLFGVGWLTGGPLAMMTWVAAAIWTAVVYWKSDPDDETTLRSALLDVLLIGGSGLALGGWWVAWMGLRIGPEFWSSWFSLRPNVVAVPSMPLQSLANLLAITLPWGGLALTGLWTIATTPEQSRTSGKVALLILAGSSIVGWGLAAVIAPSHEAGILWYRLVQMSVWLLAAEGITAILERRLPWVVSLAAVTAAWLELTSEFLADHELWHISLAGGLFAIAAASLIISILWAGEHDVRRRAVLLAILIVILPVNLRRSLAYLPQASFADRELQRLRVRLNRLPPVRRCVVVVSDVARKNPDDAARRQYLLSSLWPQAGFSELDSHTSPIASFPAQRPQEGVVDLLVSWGVREQFPGPEFTLYSSHDDLGLEVAAYVRGSQATVEEPTDGS